ncbi:MAG: M48 family metalloprotease [Gammaproteobacteria bacterium]|jgi:beta-barrel assembly-enhancing protease|nr:M48 family metalloprotease [Gammaproteobacteria bacterium]MBT6754775.1 M48 family metalloprotease [Gammaproteobacteria bacterium]MBT7523747.1 M48 family metalloprotease [Gammaproteobacteria bacterium]
MKAIIYSLILSILCISYDNSSFANNILIPKIGDTSSRFMSISQEKKLGDIIYSQILGSFNLINDPIVTSYIQMLGNRLLMSNNSSSIKYRFLVVNHPSINAFATPGGVIVINSGVILKTNSEAELASVLAHEIAHVKARHLSRMHEASSKVDITTALTVIANIIAGMYDTSTLGKTLIATQGIKAQKQISFIREHEREADRLAINILANANINPKAMSGFFKTLLKENNEANALEFLRTHPLSKNRVVETENLASKYKGNFTNDSFSYQFVSARISIKNLDTRKFIKSYLYNPNEIINSPSKAVDNYAYGLALIKEKKYEKSIIVLKNLLDFLNTKDQLYFIKNYISIALSDAYLQNNNYEAALLILEDLNNIYPTDSSVLYFLSNAYIKNKEYKKAVDILIPYVVEHRDHRLVIKISEAAYKLKEKSLGHEYRADYLKLLGSFNSSIKFYKLALKYNIKGKTIDDRILSKIKEIKRLQETKEIL